MTILQDLPRYTTAEHGQTNGSIGPQARTDFFWQGALIVLPVALFSAVGLVSLRKDRALARLAAV
jgi:hypothetical protein